jgi:ribonuclease T1
MLRSILSFVLGLVLCLGNAWSHQVGWASLATFGTEPMPASVAMALPQPIAAPNTPTLLARQPEQRQAQLPTVSVNQLPPEARKTLNLIQQGGPFPFPKDGTVFGNFEKRLPRAPRGYYREYTVITPGLSHRGARRLVTGQQGETYYTSDHYRSFSRVKF